MIVTCARCQQGFNVPVTYEQMAKWNGGMLIENAMPELSAEDRELLMSQTCGVCWEAIVRVEEY